MKIALVTGANSGIGEAVAKRLLDAGYKVYGIYKKQSSITHSNFIGLQFDLTGFEKYSTLLKLIKDDKIDILINNAGVIFEENALSSDKRSIEKTFDINFFAPIYLTKTFIKKLTGGTVINVSSVSDRLVGEESAAYCSSKAALNKYFEVIALEEKELKIISILPSYVDTPLLRGIHAGDEFDWNVPMKPEEVAKFICGAAENNYGLKSGAKVIVVNNALKEDFEYDEDLWGYNVTTEELVPLKQ